MPAKITKFGSCKFNFAVECSEHDRCERCGWNPDVKAERLKKIMRERNLKK